MCKSEITFLVEVKNNVVVNIGKSAVYYPPIKYKENGGIKWFDDVQLRKTAASM